MRGILVFTILAGTLTTGCGPKPPAPKPPAPQPPVVAAPDKPPESPGDGPRPTLPASPTADVNEPSLEPPAEADLQPPVVSTSPIDLVDEGRLYRRALEHYERGEMTLVEEARDQLIDHRNYRPLGQALDALLMSHRGDHKQAMHVAEELSTSPLMQAESFVIAGEVFRQQHRLSDAIACLRNAVQRNPAHAVAHRWLGAIHLETGAMVLATEHFRAAANADPRDGPSLVQSGQIHLAFDGFESAVEDFRRALNRDLDQVTDVAVRLLLADALLALERPNEALEAVQPCDDIAPVMAVRGQCHLAKGDIAAATQSADDALDKSPEDRRALLLRSQIYMDHQDYRAAIPLLETVVADERDLELLELLLECVRHTDDTERVDKLTEQVTELQQFQQQVAELKLKAVDRPQDAQARIQIAEALEEHQQIPAAIWWYEAAVGLDPTLQSVRDKLHRLKDPLLPPLESLPVEPPLPSDDPSA